MKRLVYLYVANGSADINQIPNWSCLDETQESFALNFHTEGFAHLFKRFIQEKVFDEILVVIESNRSPGTRPLSEGISILVVPHIETLWPFLRKEDILWARGGWRTWWKFLDEWNKLDRWLLFYRAASNRGAWEFWDIVLDDLRILPSIDGLGRYYFPINKPTNPELFFPKDVPKIFDVCVGASHVHDKKGQWRITEICDKYKELYGEDLSCVLPGSIHHGEKTHQFLKWLDSHHHHVALTSMIPRHEMNLIYNQSRLFVHLGAGGQNDRGPLEALACGTPVAIANPDFHAPFLSANVCPVLPFTFELYPNNPQFNAMMIRSAISLVKKYPRQFIADWYNNVNGIDTVILPRFKFLFDLLQKNDRSNKEAVLNQLTAYRAENAYTAI